MNNKLTLVRDSMLEEALAMKCARALDDVQIMEFAAAEKKLDQAACYAGNGSKARLETKTKNEKRVMN